MVGFLLKSMGLMLIKGVYQGLKKSWPKRGSLYALGYTLGHGGPVMWDTNQRFYWNAESGRLQRTGLNLVRMLLL